MFSPGTDLLSGIIPGCFCGAGPNVPCSHPFCPPKCGGMVRTLSPGRDCGISKLCPSPLDPLSFGQYLFPAHFPGYATCRAL